MTDSNKIEEKKQDDNGGDNKKSDNKNKNNNNEIVIKIEMHCVGCVSKITKLARSFSGVETVNADMKSSKLSVTGSKVDPVKLRDYLHSKTKKRVDLISPQPKKDDKEKGKNKNNDHKPDSDKKPKEVPVTTAVIKLGFHCNGCIEKINKIVAKTKGIHEVIIDKQKETVTVKGTMDVKGLTETLKEKLKRNVEIVPSKKEKEGNVGEKDGGKKKGGDGKDNAGGNGNNASAGVEGNRMDHVMMHPGYWVAPPLPYGYMGQPVYGHEYQPVYPIGPDEYGYGYGYGGGFGQGSTVPGYPTHMRFNDENPNACSVM